MNWLTALDEGARRGEPLVLVTVARVRGHAPRGAGAKMVVGVDAIHGSVGGGDLEARAVARARALLAPPPDTDPDPDPEAGPEAGPATATGPAEPELLVVRLNPTSGEHGVQCCGGEVTLLLEPLWPRRPCVAVFGAGHVGRALLQALAPLPLDLRLVDSRAALLHDAELPAGATARLQRHHAPLPESAVASLPAGAHLVILTHDHAEDLAVLDVALRRAREQGDLGYLGLIGSTTKWAHFRRRLLDEGHREEDLARVTTPIGVPGVRGKQPAVIAIATAAQLLERLDLPEHH